MKITLTRHGGLASPITSRLPPKVVDTATMPKVASEELVRLVAAAKSAPKSEEKPKGIAGDPMSFTISVEGDGRPVTLKQSDPLSGAFAALLDFLEGYSQKK